MALVLFNFQMSPDGFTLIELLVVLLIVVILALISVPSVIGYLDNVKIWTEAIKLQSVLRKAQAIAFSEQVRCSVVLDEMLDRYDILVNGKIRTRYFFEKGIELLPAACTFPVSNGKLSVIFTPEYGIPTKGGSIAIGISSLMKRLIVSAVTGRVRIQ